ncbi:hypothetical protein BBJ28_00014763 [Nothophytophthora sp. Chile5]|nr:hypothetical protein BBJ28_00014763 [Nothophytophthora sp. Chile5]
MCFFCSSAPVENDVRKDNPSAFHVGMMHAPGADPLLELTRRLRGAGCLGSCLCPCCAQIVIRRKALHYDMSNYTCCQGYMDGLAPGVRAGHCGESNCPNFCLCLEVTAFAEYCVHRAVHAQVNVELNEREKAFEVQDEVIERV